MNERWFRLWVAVSERILGVQLRVLGRPIGGLDARARIWIAERLSWSYHRVLDLATVGMRRAHDALHADKTPHGHGNGLPPDHEHEAGSPLTHRAALNREER